MKASRVEIVETYANYIKLPGHNWTAMVNYSYMLNPQFLTPHSPLQARPLARATSEAKNRHVVHCECVIRWAVICAKVRELLARSYK